MPASQNAIIGNDDTLSQRMEYAMSTTTEYAEGNGSAQTPESKPGLRKLPSADWIAVVVGLTAMAMSYVWSPLLSVVSLAIFAPSVLREVGLLRDSDEYTRQLTYRAGFHAMLSGAFLFVLQPILWDVVGVANEAYHNFAGGNPLLGGETLRKVVVWVFLISTLIQYWGAHQGVFRILMGAAVLTLAPIAALLRQWPDLGPTYLLASLGFAVLLALLGLLVRWRPRVGGGVLTALCVVALLGAASQLGSAETFWGMISGMIQAVVVLGTTGVALLVETGRVAETS